eukprot:2916980-Karenia_brevis.AAC.1
MLGRTLAKHLEHAHKVRHMLQHYQRQQHADTKHQFVKVQELTAAPTPGAAGRKGWKAEHAPMGPISL